MLDAGGVDHFNRFGLCVQQYTNTEHSGSVVNTHVANLVLVAYDRHLEIVFCGPGGEIVRVDNIVHRLKCDHHSPVNTWNHEVVEELEFPQLVVLSSFRSGKIHALILLDEQKHSTSRSHVLQSGLINTLCRSRVHPCTRVDNKPRIQAQIRRIKNTLQLGLARRNT